MSKDYLWIEVSDTQLHPGDVVTISTYGDFKWIVKKGWYQLNNARKNGWYFFSISDKTVIPADMINLEEVSLVNSVPPSSSDIDDSHSSIENPKPQKALNSDDECKYITIPNTSVRLYDGDIVKISKYPKSKWIVHCGWYIDDSQQNYGWYLSNIKSGKTLPVNIIDLTTCTLISSYTQGSTFRSGPELNYTRPFTDSDAEILNRTFISVDTIEQRDNLDTSKLINGRMVRVNDVEGTIAYYAWNAKTQSWEETALADTIQRVVGSAEHPVILSELDSNVYLIYGQYKVSPNDPTVHITLANILAEVNTNSNQKYIKLIDNRSMSDYIVEEGDITLTSIYATTDYIDQHYATKVYVDEKFAILEAQIQEILDILDDRIRQIAREEDRLYSTDIAQEYIDNLFDN